MSIYHTFIVVPLIFFLLLVVVFSTQLGTQISNQEFLFNCPYPSQNQHALIGTPSMLPFNTFGDNSERGATYINYTLQNPSAIGNSSATGQGFICYISDMKHNNVPQAQPLFNSSQPSYGQTVVYFPIGWFAWAGDTIGQATAKFGAGLGLLYIFVTAPQQVTGVVLFSYIELILLCFIALGGFMLIRGNNG